MQSSQQPFVGLGLASLFALAPSLMTSTALAQSAAQRTAEVTELEEIVVTGSRIRRSVNDQILPTITLDQTAVDSRGYHNVGEAVLDQPFFSKASSNHDTKFNQSAVDVGFTFIDLFGLGSERTLTLVDGKRAVSSAAPQPSRTTGSAGLQVDINTIPSALIERIETITIGGAPIYGADAIAGTVNVILKKRFEGVQVDAQSGITEEGDGLNYRLRGTFGQNFMNDRGNFVLAAEYSKRDGLTQSDRPGANNIQVTNPMLATDPVGFFNADPPLPLNTYQLDTGFPGASAYGSPVSPAVAAAFGTGAVIGSVPFGFAQNAAGETLMFNEQGELITVPMGDGNGTFLFTQNQPSFPGLYRTQDYFSLLNESERKTVSSLGSIEIGEHTRFTYRANYSRLEAMQLIGSPVVLATPVTPGILVSIDNPFLSSTARATLRSAQTNVGATLPFLFAGDDFVLGKTLAEFGTRGNVATSDNGSIVTGFEGQLGLFGRQLDWDLTYSYGRTETDTTSRGVNGARFALATDAVMVDDTGAIITDSSTFAEPSGFQFDAATGGYVNAAAGQHILCRARVLGLPGGDSCLPFNPFGAQNRREVIDWLAADSVLSTEIQQQFLQGNISGVLGKLPAGDFSAAVGFEVREEKASFTADPLTLEGGLLGFEGSISPVSGKFNSKEVYFETAVPLLSRDIIDSDFFKLFELEGAVRLIDNSRAGSDVTWTAGARWEIGDSIVIRGNRTQSVRAPAIAQLYAGSAPIFTGLADPCANSNINGGSFAATRRANCIAEVIATGLAPDEAAALEFLQTFSGSTVPVPGTVGGNLDLENEEAKAWTVGVVLRPSFIRGLSLAVDWNAIRLNGAIEDLTGSDILASCYDSGSFPNMPTCARFTRDDQFRVLSYSAGFINVGYIDFAALTATLDYAAPVGPGALHVSAGALVLDKSKVSTDGVSEVERRDTVGFEKYRARMALSYSIGSFTGIWDTTYVPGAWLAASDRDGLTNTFEFPKTDSYMQHDLSLLYSFNDHFGLRVVVNNLTEEQQPGPFAQFASVQARLGRTYLLGMQATF